jgi:hypothetical protein
MPVITGVQGFTGLTQAVRLCLEPTAGEQVLLAQTAGASTMSLTTQPNTFSPTTGMHLHFFVIGNTAAGTITIAGTAPGTGSAVNSITYHVPVAPQNAQGYTEFTTKEVFATVNASGITLTSLTPCQVIVFGSYAGKYLIPITEDDEEKIAKFSPQDKRGILFKNLRVSQLTKGVSLDKFDAALYPDSLWAPYMSIGNTPSVTTVPATPTSLLSSTAIAATMTLTTSPVAPGEFLIFTISSNTASGTIVVNGTDQYGNAYASSETITFTSAASQTVYSSRRYSAVNTGGANKFTTTGGTGSSIAVTGVYAWTYTWTFDGITNPTPYSASLEVFDGVEGYILPYTHFASVDFAWAKEKEITLSAKGEAQDKCIVGDNSPTSTANYLSGTNPFATLSQPSSLPMVSWPASYYLDLGNGGTPFTTQDGSFEDFKLQIMTGRKPFYSGDGQQRWSNVTWESEPDFAVDATVVYQTYQNYVNYFKPNTPALLGVTFQGSYLGAISSTVYYEQIQWTLPVKIDSFKIEKSKSPVAGVLKLMSEYSFANLGYAYKCAWTCQVPPVYPN